MSLSGFHPVIERWFGSRFREPTEPQRRAWPLIQAGRNALIAAPTGSGKTFAAFLAAIDSLLRQGLDGTLTDGTQVVYVSPLKALSNDVQKNLAEPLAEIRRTLEASCLPDVEIRTLVRTGVTPGAERQEMVRRPPHILVTTPESLYLILTSERAREMLRGVRTVIVDEIHAVARDKRGSHLALSLERLEHLAGRRLQRIGLSATQKPIEDIAQFLVGTKRAPSPESQAPSVIDSGHARTLDLAIEIPSSPLEAVMAAEVWEEIYERLVQLILEHRTTLVFVNTRRLAERLTLHLSERLGADQVTSHHGSLSKEKRLDAETRLKGGKLKALVATASLELGIDIGAVDLVSRIGSTRSIPTLLHHAARAAWRVRPLRWRESPAARAARRPARRAHIGRGHTGHRRLPRDPRADRDLCRNAQRRFRHREHAGRHLPAGQPVVSDPEDRVGPGARRRRPRPASIDPLLAGRGAGSHAGAVTGSVPAAPGRRRPTGGSGRGDHLACGRDPGRPRARRPSDDRVSRRLEEDPGSHPDAGDPRAGALLRRGGRDAARAARAVRESGEPRVGARPPQAVLPQLQLRAPGRRHRRRDRPVARTPAQLPPRGCVPVSEARDRGASVGAGDARRADVRLALALERDPGAGRAARARREEGSHAAPAHGCGGLGRRRVPRPARVPRKPRGGPRDSRSPAGATDHRGLSARGDGLPEPERRARRNGGGAVHARGARHDGAVPARARGDQRQAVRLPRRRAAGRAPHSGGDHPARARRQDCGGAREARSGGDRSGEGRGVAGGRLGRRAARCAAGDGGHSERGSRNAERDRKSVV